MLLVFCLDSLETSRPDRAFEDETAAADRLGLPRVLVDYDALIRGDEPALVVRRILKQPEPSLAVYRGWMMTPAQYQGLHEALAEKNIRLVNDPVQYRHCHHLPENYPVIQGLTPRSIWLTGDLGIDRVMESLIPFGDAPVIVKDFVKSQKHKWTEACYIPSAADRESVERIATRFLELQGEHLAGGLVFREYVEFEPIGIHPRSRTPLTEEYRVFWLDGVPFFWSSYWAEGNYQSLQPPIESFIEVAGAVQSRFFTMDVARLRDGGWMIVELGDGQVSGLPHLSDAERFYKALSKRRPQ